MDTVLPQVTIDLNRVDTDVRVQAPQGGAAANLSHMGIYAVYSPQAGVEYIGMFDHETRNEHGGGVLIIVTREIGYGGAPLALFNNKRLPPSANYHTQPICVRHAHYVTPCKAGETSVGFFRYWQISNKQSGTFFYQNVSSNAPFNTVRQRVNIRYR